MTTSLSSTSRIALDTLETRLRQLEESEERLQAIVLNNWTVSPDEFEGGYLVTTRTGQIIGKGWGIEQALDQARYTLANPPRVK